MWTTVRWVIRSGVCVLDSKMFRQLEALGLIVRADAHAVERGRPRQHALVDQAADDLAVLEDERHLARAHLEYRAGTAPAGALVAESRIEEARAAFAKERSRF